MHLICVRYYEQIIIPGEWRAGMSSEIGAGAHLFFRCSSLLCSCENQDPAKCSSEPEHFVFFRFKKARYPADPLGFISKKRFAAERGCGDLPPKVHFRIQGGAGGVTPSIGLTPKKTGHATSFSQPCWLLSHRLISRASTRISPSK
jgi:hypothetical protein